MEVAARDLHRPCIAGGYVIGSIERGHAEVEGCPDDGTGLGGNGKVRSRGDAYGSGTCPAATGVAYQ